jgi:glycine cleavage system H protein
MGDGHMKVDEYEMPDDLYYHAEHTWVRREGDIVTVGMNDFAQKLAGIIKRVQTLEEGDDIQKDKPCGTISSGKWTGKLYAPVTGEIVEVNEDVEDEPKLINDSPYSEGWIFKVKLSEESELGSLIQGAGVEEWLKGEITKHKKE